MSESELLDLLIVGGGPAGTAAAFRGRELGLKVLIIEFDDLMKRIRDYSKDKLILPSFGGGDQMCFPQGGEMIASLRFGPIDKDDMCVSWKDLHAKHGIPSRIGVELNGLQRHEKGPYAVQVFDHSNQTAEVIWAQHVLVAIGRGAPRRFDIPGNTEGIAFQLRDPAGFVGQPACVVGGGTSAAEAVIAISRAKVTAGDKTAVYWSYRGDKMPRVSKALAEVFFEAYVGNGNIRYFPNSDPAAVVTGDDRREYVSIRVDRREMRFRPTETSHLEFPKECCIACIGEDIPEPLLATLGTPMQVGGPRRRKRVVVNKYLETQQPNVYMAGDILSQAYFETDDFAAGPETFREVKHRGNIKTAMRDGVLVAQIVKQRLDGVEAVDLHVADDPTPDLESDVSRKVPLAKPRATPHPSSVEVSRAIDAPHLVRLLPGGVQDQEYPLNPDTMTTLGRRGCDISFEADTELAPQHASLMKRGESWLLRDDGSETGVFLQVPSTRRIELRRGDLLRIGRQFLLIAGGRDGFGYTHFDAQGREQSKQVLPDGTVVLGRQAPDFTLDPKDGTLSRRQVSLTHQGGKLFIKDLKSANGSFLRVQREIELEHGDRFRIGQQLLGFTQRDDMVFDEGSVSSAVPTLPVPKSGDVTLTGLHVSFAGHQAVAATEGQTVCDVAELGGLPINAECHSGICGSDPIRILAGRENLLDEASAGERETLEDICGLEPGDCRLACMVRFKGPVEVEIL